MLVYILTCDLLDQERRQDLIEAPYSEFSNRYLEVQSVSGVQSAKRVKTKIL